MFRSRKISCATRVSQNQSCVLKKDKFDSMIAVVFPCKYEIPVKKS